jgi:hypothetical protein
MRGGLGYGGGEVRTIAAGCDDMVGTSISDDDGCRHNLDRTRMQVSIQR